MKLKYKFLKKVLSIALITEMVLNPVLVPWTIYAQEADPTPTPTVTIEEITPTDMHWGIGKGNGKNYLGKILMALRGYYREHN